MFVTIITFIIVLAILVFVHEFGHFFVAKRSGMKVEEFGFGFPPRILGIQKTDRKWRVVWGSKIQNQQSSINNVETDSTIYSINLIPLGGFVRILGENNEQENDPRSFINRPFWGRFLTLVAGVCMNVILAWVIFSAGYMIGLPVGVDTADQVPAHAHFTNPQIAILEVVPGQPADKAGIQVNDIVESINGTHFDSVLELQQYIRSHAGDKLDFKVSRGSKVTDHNVDSIKNPAPGQGSTGIGLSLVGNLSFPWYLALYEGLKTTGIQIALIVKGLVSLITPYHHISLSSVGGPVQIAKLTGQVQRLGFVHLIQFTAFLSLNLAVLNILPFPALDGGRVLFLIIEKIRGKRNNQKFEQIVNTAGFVFLLLLMVVVTVKDIIKK